MISHTAEYALRAVVCLAHSGDERLTTPRIAGVTHVPPGYLAKVLRALARDGVIDSQRGLGGGFELVRDPHEITLLEVVNAVDPLRRITSCPLTLTEHQTDLCALHCYLDETIAMVMERFASTTVADLLDRAAEKTSEGRSAFVLGLCIVPRP